MNKLKQALQLRALLSFLVMMVFAASVSAQTISVSGHVTDETGEPLIGAAILQKGTQNGTATDYDGNYSIKVPAKATLVVSYMGYQSQEVNVGGKTILNIKLAATDHMLEEVVAIGYGTVKKKDLTGAVSSVQGADLAKVPVGSVAQALQGKAPGLNIVQQNAAPGASVNVTVRGGASLTQGTAPLYIVDGFAMDNALSNLDANDIESIDVLKDASATAIYGARGSNGIIVITTKSAAKGKTKVDYNAFFTWDKLSKKLDMLSDAADYVRYQYELAELQGKTSMWSVGYDNSYATDEADFYSGVYGRISDRYTGDYATDWQDLMFGGNSFSQNHNVSVSTGSEKTQVLLTFNHNDQNGLLANHDFNRNSVRAKVNSELYKGVKLDFGTFFYNNVTHGGGKYGDMKGVLLQPINGGTLFTQDELINTQTYRDYRGLDNGFDTANPLVQNEASTSESKDRLLNITGGLTIDFVKGLTWRTAGDYETKWTRSTSFADENSTSYLIDQTNTGINGTIKYKETSKWRISNTLNYNHTFAQKHNLTALLGQEYSYSESIGNNFELKQFPYPNHGLDDISNATVNDKSSSRSHGNMLSFFGRAGYNYDERYLLTATLRADGSSKFARGNKWGYFPSASAAWRVSQEGFWQNSSLVETVNNLKLRVGYGVTGNCDIDDNMYTTPVSMSTYPMGNDENSAAYVIGTTLGNEKLKWETLHATNVGLDLGLINSRINLTVEWYNNQINDMLMKCSIPKSTGYSYQYQNVGKMRNRGWEVSLNTVNISNRRFQWTSTLNLSFNRSKVIALEGDVDHKTFSQGGNRSGTVQYYAVVGEPLGDMYGYKYIGLYTTDDFDVAADGSYTLKEGVVKPYSGTPQPGDIKFAADNEDGTQFTRQLQKIGNGTPDCIGGFNNTLTWKGFDLNVFLRFSIGNDVYNATKHSMSPYAPYQNTTTEFGNYYRLIDPLTGKKATTLDRIRELNPDEQSRTWSLSKTNSDYITYPSSFYVEDGSYLRLSQVTLGYTLPDKWMKKLHIAKCRIYFTGNNLATITGYSGYNPDASSANDDVICTPGYDSSVYPLSRSYVVGVNLSF